MKGITKEELTRLYIDEDLNVNTIVKQTGRSHRYIKKKLEEFGLSKTKVYMDKDWLYNKYIVENLTTTEIAELCGVTDPTIATALRSFEIKKDHEVLQKSRMEKVIKTNIERFEKEHCFQSEIVKEKIKSSMIERYGVDNPMKSKKIRQKSYNTNLERFGVKHPAQSGEINLKAMKTKEKSGLVRFINGNDTVNTICAKAGIPIVNAYKLIREGKLSPDNIYNYIHNYESPVTHLEKVASENFSLEFYNKYFDLDRFPSLKYKPDFKINDKAAINVDGLYWHSESNQANKNYHFNLRKSYEDLGLRVFQFREDEVYHNIEIIKSIINNYLGKSQKIYARKTKLAQLSSEEYKSFFTNNHLMGSANAITFGLILNGEIVMAASYKVFSDRIKIERLCSKMNTVIIGGASKLLNKIKEITPKLPIHYWADLRYGTGNYLEKLGFKKERDTVGFKWTDCNKTFNRLRCRANMDDRKLSQEEYAKELGWVKIWDAGQRLWILNQ